MKYYPLQLMRGWLLLAPATVLTVSIGSQPSARHVANRASAIQHVSIAPGSVVVITGSGPLPQPIAGVLHSPERIYLDLPAVSARASAVSGNDALVSAVRVAQHSVDPPVARIVIDLTQPSRYAVNASQRDSGRLEISLTPIGRPAAPRAESAPPASAPPASVPSAPVRPKPADSAARRYVTRVEQALSDAAALRQVLKDLDRKAAVSPELFQPAQAQLGNLRTIVDGLRPPASLADAHDLLRSAVGFATSALTLASGSPAEVPANASSAAAGALLMLDRAEAELAVSQKIPMAQFAGGPAAGKLVLREGHTSRHPQSMQKVSLLAVALAAVVVTTAPALEAAPAPSTSSVSSAAAALDVDAWDTGSLGNIDRGVFAAAVDAAQSAIARGQVAVPSTLTIIDYTRPSTEKRMWVYDLRSHALLFDEWVSHGRGSGKNLATTFSNDADSNMSSLGLFKTAEAYEGHNGYSLRLDGLQPGVNDHARERAIVIHGAPYVNPVMARAQGYLGRSLGCPAVRPEIAHALIDAVKGGGLLFAYGGRA